MAWISRPPPVKMWKNNLRYTLLDKEEFVNCRKRLGKTQKQIAELLGTSIKAVHSYEQGWRTIPTHVERQFLFLLSRKRPGRADLKPCWVVKKCPPARRRECPAWEFQAGKLCWFISGTICECKARKSWAKKMEVCRSCSVVISILSEKDDFI